MRTEFLVRQLELVVRPVAAAPRSDGSHRVWQKVQQVDGCLLRGRKMSPRMPVVERVGGRLTSQKKRRRKIWVSTCIL